MRGRARVWLIAALALVSSCSRPPPIEARPALWRVTDADTTIWLLGTIHALPAGVAWQTPAVTTAIDSAESLVLEIAPPREADAQALFERVTIDKRQPPIISRVAPARRAALLRAIDAAGSTLAEFDVLKSWAAAVTITSGVGRAKGVTRENGVEAVLGKAFARRTRPVRGFETLAGQFALFDGLPERDQRVLLDQAIDGAAHDGGTLDAWRKGDTARLEATLAPGFAQAPGLEDVLVTRRNARWSGWIVRRMARPGRVLVAVGAGHLVGPRSVVAMLRARGLTVVRVE